MSKRRRRLHQAPVGSSVVQVSPRNDADPGGGPSLAKLRTRVNGELQTHTTIGLESSAA